MISNLCYEIHWHHPPVCQSYTHEIFFGCPKNIFICKLIIRWHLLPHGHCRKSHWPSATWDLHCCNHSSFRLILSCTVVISYYATTSRYNPCWPDALVIEHYWYHACFWAKWLSSHYTPESEAQVYTDSLWTAQTMVPTRHKPNNKNLLVQQWILSAALSFQADPTDRYLNASFTTCGIISSAIGLTGLHVLPLP